MENITKKNINYNLLGGKGFLGTFTSHFNIIVDKHAYSGKDEWVITIHAAVSNDVFQKYNNVYLTGSVEMLVDGKSGGWIGFKIEDKHPHIPYNTPRNYSNATYVGTVNLLLPESGDVVIKIRTGYGGQGEGGGVGDYADYKYKIITK